jgi:hypothetical protein
VCQGIEETDERGIEWVENGDEGEGREEKEKVKNNESRIKWKELRYENGERGKREI